MKILLPLITSFTNKKGETLPLSEIADKKIISINICYLSKSINEKYFFNLFTRVKEQEEKNIEICDNSGILFFQDRETLANIRFSSGDEFNKLKKDSFDEGTINKGYIFNILPPYKIIFDTRNIQEIDWV